nr:hypothetical protein [uncultured Desulfobacter sp.]
MVQVKKFKPSPKASDKNSFSEVVTQLQQASEKKIPNADGVKYSPEKVYFITPFPLEVRALESRFEGLSNLRHRRVKIIDGPKLTQLLITKVPHLVENIIGKGSLIVDATISSLTNKELLNALNYNSDIDIASFYSDLEFGIGKITTKFFSILTFQPQKISIKCDKDEWQNLKRISNVIELNFSERLIVDDVALIDNLFYEQDNKNANISVKISEIANQVRSLENSANNFEEDLLSEEERILKEFTLLRTKLSKKDKNKVESFLNIVDFFRKDRDNQKFLSSEERDKNQKEFEKNLKKYNEIIRDKGIEQFEIKKHADIFNRQKEISYEMPNLLNIKDKLEKQVTTPTCRVEINGKGLTNSLKNEQKWLLEQTKKINIKSQSIKDIAIFLKKCLKLFDATEVILGNQFVQKALGCKPKVQYGNLEKIARLQIPIKKIFDTRYNIFILGGAGAGKTTTLQIYTKYKLENSGGLGNHFFLPLARVVYAFQLKYIEGSIDSPIKKLVFAILQYYKSLGINLTDTELKEIFENGKTTLLFDGLDEVITKTPWLIESIHQFSEAYPKTQLIVSSRESRHYIDKLPFMSVTLLPFTDTQRKKFIQTWFEKKPYDKTDDLVTHLEKFKELSEIVRIPLLTTVFCVLAENDIPLPQTETRLYEERMRLLLGVYDIHKKATRITSEHQLLETVARKIAFEYHYKGIRYDHKETISKKITSKLRDKVEKKQILLAIEELIDPCNVLMPMTDDGMIGFGHLRYQEYLAAMELCRNRGIDISRLLNSWWKDTLVLFSSLTDDIEFIINQLVTECRIGERYHIINEMLQVRPKKERFNFQEILDTNRDLDYGKIDFDFNEFDDFIG